MRHAAPAISSVLLIFLGSRVSRALRFISRSYLPDVSFCYGMINFSLYSDVTRVGGKIACPSRVTGGIFSEGYKLVWKKYPIQNC